MPPATTIVSAVTYDASDDSRYATVPISAPTSVHCKLPKIGIAPPISSLVASRPIGTRSDAPCSSLQSPSLKRVLTIPGARQLTRIPCGASSMARACVRPSSAVLLTCAHPHASARPNRAQRSSKRAHRVDAEEGARVEAGDRRHKDDGRSGAHVRDGLLGKQKGSADIDIKDLVPLLFGKVEHRAHARRHGRIRHETVDPAPLANRHLDKRLALFGIAAVGSAFQ